MVKVIRCVTVGLPFTFLCFIARTYRERGTSPSNFEGNFGITRNFFRLNPFSRHELFFSAIVRQIKFAQLLNRMNFIIYSSARVTSLIQPPTSDEILALLCAMKLWNFKRCPRWMKGFFDQWGCKRLSRMLLSHEWNCRW